MYSNLLDLLVQKLEIAKDLEAQERRLIKREEENEGGRRFEKEGERGQPTQ